MNINFNTAMPWAGVRRCILAQNGTVVGYLHPDNSNKWEDGSDVDWVAVETNVQNCMVEIPKFYYCKKVVSSPKEERIFGVSDEPVQTNKIDIDDWEIHPAFFRERTKLCDDQTGVAVEVDYRYAPAFRGWKDASNRLRSLPGKRPTTSLGLTHWRPFAKNMGNSWSQFDYNLLYALQMLYITEYGNPDSQAAIGKGPYTYVSMTGTTLEKGNHSYGNAFEPISYRGVENLWEGRAQWVEGLFIDDNRNVRIGQCGFNDVGNGCKIYEGGFTANWSANACRDIFMATEAGFIPRVGAVTGGLPDYTYIKASVCCSMGGVNSPTSGGSAGGGIFYLNCSYPRDGHSKTWAHHYHIKKRRFTWPIQ